MTYKKAVKCNECGKLLCLAWRGLHASMPESCCPHCGQDYSSFSLDGSVGDGKGFSIVTAKEKGIIFKKYEEVPIEG